MENCEYCAEFRRGYLGVQEIGNRIVYETNNFVVFPSLGQIVEGYLIIAPKNHYICIGGIPEELYSELEDMQQKVRKILEESYTTPLFFEHGPVSSSRKGGSCIDHAHFHAVPVKLDIFNDLSRDFPTRSVNSYTDLKMQFEKGIPYFYLEDNLGKRYLFEIEDQVPSQYIRRLIASKINNHEKWDWGIYLGLDELVRTLEKLKGRFE